MNTEYAPMSAADLVASIAGEYLTMPELVLETIKEDDTLMHIVREYGRGRLDYVVVSAAVGEYL